jgi:hypothetical protein
MTGCSAAYVNLPALDGDVASNDANNATPVEMQIAALRRVLRERPPTGPYAIALPRGTNAESYNRIVAELPPGSQQYGSQSGPMPVYRVTRVFGRPTNGEVDILAPRPGGGEDLVNAYLLKDIEGWYVQRTRVWRVPLNKVVNVLPPDEGESLPQAPAPTRPTTSGVPAPASAPYSADDTAQ